MSNPSPILWYKTPKHTLVFSTSPSFKLNAERIPFRNAVVECTPISGDHRFQPLNHRSRNPLQPPAPSPVLLQSGRYRRSTSRRECRNRVVSTIPRNRDGGVKVSGFGFPPCEVGVEQCSEYLCCLLCRESVLITRMLLLRCCLDWLNDFIDELKNSRWLKY